MKKKLILVLALLIIVFLPGFVAAQQSRAISWSMALQNVKSGEMVSFSTPVQATTGEQFRLVISPASVCYCYVVIESDDDVAVLYSGRMNNRDSWYSPTLQLAPPEGSESLFVVVSREEQRNLAQRITAFKNNSGSIQRRALMNEIFRLRSEISQFRESPEVPVLMGGASRGDSGKNTGVEFSGLETYVKIISIQH